MRCCAARAASQRSFLLATRLPASTASARRSLSVLKKRARREEGGGTLADFSSLPAQSVQSVVGSGAGMLQVVRQSAQRDSPAALYARRCFTRAPDFRFFLRGMRANADIQCPGVPSAA